MDNKPPQKNEDAVETIVSGLRDEYRNQTPANTKPDAPKKGKELHMGQARKRWLNMLTLLLIFLGVVVSVGILTFNNGQAVANNVTTTVTVDEVPAADLINLIEPTLPALAQEPIPTELPYILPEATAWPTPAP